MNMPSKFQINRKGKKYRINIWEFERGWGSKIDSTESFDTYEEAAKRVRDFNKRNDKDHVPDWYMVAEPENFTINPYNERR